MTFHIAACNSSQTGPSSTGAADAEKADSHTLSCAKRKGAPYQCSATLGNSYFSMRPAFSEELDGRALFYAVEGIMPSGHRLYIGF
jgi:hypothetical protein